MDPEHGAKLLETIRQDVPDQAGQNRTALLGLFDAITRGKVEDIAAFLTDDVQLDICGSGTMDGSWRGRDAVVKAACANFSQLADQKPKIESMVAQDDAIAVLISESGVYQDSKKPYSYRVVQWFTFSDGRIRRIDEIAAGSAA